MLNLDTAVFLMNDYDKVVVANVAVDNVILVY